MGIFKALAKLTLVIGLAAVCAGAMMIAKRPALKSRVSYDQWPDVSRNPAAPPGTAAA